MKQFFLDLLSNLDKLAGLRQIEKIYAQHADQGEAKKEINTLLTILVNICAQFPYIPEEEKKRIIQQAVVTDPEFNSLNARIVYKWLAVQKDKYYKEISAIENPIPENYEIVTGEKREEYLNQWLKALEPMQERINPVSKKEVLILGKERQGKTEYVPTMSAEDLDAHAKHLAYLRANYEARSGNKLEGWMPEDQWNELNK